MANCPRSEFTSATARYCPLEMRFVIKGFVMARCDRTPRHGVTWYDVEIKDF